MWKRNSSDRRAPAAMCLCSRKASGSLQRLIPRARLKVLLKVLMRLLKARLKVLLKVLTRLVKARLKVLLKVLTRLLKVRLKVLLKVLLRLLKARLKVLLQVLIMLLKARLKVLGDQKVPCSAAPPYKDSKAQMESACHAAEVDFALASAEKLTGE